MYIGIHLDYSSNNLITNNIIRDNRNTGIILTNSNSTTISNNILTFSDTNNGNGISINSGYLNEVYKNTLTDAITGISIGGRSNLIFNNTLKNCNNGFLISGQQNIIFNNAVKDCKWVGIMLQFWGNLNTIFNNSIINSSNGITFNYASSNNITSNKITNNTYGIVFYYESKDNKIFNNLISSNEYGIDFNKQTSKDNKILSNSFCPLSKTSDFIGSYISENSGDENQCNKPNRWNDTGTTGCTYECPLISISCDNDIWDGDETGIDCGGSCNPCASCSNGIQDGDETDIDCGGSCPFVCGACKPYIVNGNHDDKIDVVFVPDRSYNGDFELFKEHIGLIINNSYKKSAPINDNLNKFNFYYIEEQSWTNWTTFRHHLPHKFKTECSFYDSAAIIHTDSYRDFASGKKFSSEYYSNGTFIHESGHAIFGLADEYCCDSYYYEPRPFPNIYPNEADCRQDAINESWNPNDCKLFCDPNQNTSNRANNCGDGWWRSDPGPDIMNTSIKVYPFQRADLRNVYWTFDEYPGTTMKVMAAEPTEDKKVVILDLYFENKSINLTDVKIIYNDAPDYITQSGDVNLILIKNSSTIKDIKIWDPRTIITEEGAYYLDTGNTSIQLGVNLDEDFINVYYNHSPVLSMNLKEYFRDFCSFQDGKCDKDCLDNVGFDVDCFSIKLNKGWNLISFPLILNNNSLSNLLNNTNYTKIFYYNSKYKELGKNETIDERYGLWIHILNDSIIETEGKSFVNPIYNLSRGWNLIGYPYLEEKNISEFFDNLNITAVYSYNGSWLSYIPERPFNSIQTLKSSYGYWVKIE